MQKLTFEEVYTNTYIRKSVSVFVEQQVRRYPILGSHCDDIEQELWICISRAINLFCIEGSASIETFVRKVIERRINNIRGKYFTENSRTMFYSTPIEPGDDLPIPGKDEIREIELKMDIADAIANLTAEQQMVCRMIMRGDSLTIIASRLKISQSSLYHFYIYPIRDEFKREKIEKYLENL